ncbi:MAG TPA: hypothetical protein DCW90_21600 [Lachnospiraceae bacterium]|nr:hypothetical protein [uncultured Lachnoclostridium sp.]HAU87973.1 hypothetical protein [Lachnospiraceae bacterium]
MIKWYPALYLDSVTKKNLRKIKRRMERRKINLSVYCIALASNEKNLLDIYSTNELLYRYYRHKDIKVIGLASNKENAIQLVADIVNDVYQQTGRLDVRTFFKEDE